MSSYKIEVQCNKNYFKNVLAQEAGASRNNRKRTAKTTPKIEKKIEYLQEIFALPTVQSKWYFFASMY